MYRFATSATWILSSCPRSRCGRGPGAGAFVQNPHNTQNSRIPGYPGRQALVRLCETINYGSIENLEVRDCEPAFDPAPVMLRGC
jgi:hypothetical protein